MVRTYLRYESAHAGGVVLSPFCDAIHVVKLADVLPNHLPNETSPNPSKLAQVFLTAGARRLQFIDTESGDLLHAVPIAPEGNVKDTGHITTVHLSSDAATISVGMSTGRVSIFQYEAEEEDFNEQCSALAHRLGTKVGVLCTNEDITENERSDRTLLASGGQDTTIVIWDLFAKEAIGRLEGHKGPIVGLHFLRNAAGWNTSSEYLLSVAEDGLMKLWDIAQDCCVQTILVSETANFVTASAYCADLGVVLLATKDSFLRAYNVNDTFSLEETAESTASDGRTQFLSPLQDIPRRESRQIQHIALVRWSEKKDSQTFGFLCISKDRLVEVFSRVESAKSRRKALKRAAEPDALPSSGIFYTGVLYAAASKIACATPVVRKERFKKTQVDLAIGLRNNTLQTIPNFPNRLVTSKSENETQKKLVQNTMLQLGHSGEVTNIALNSGGTAIITASLADGIRRWHLSEKGGTSNIVCNGFVPCPNLVGMITMPDDTTLLCANTAGELIRISLGSLDVEQTVLIEKDLGGKAKATGMCLGGGLHEAKGTECVLYTCNADTQLRAYPLKRPFHLPAVPSRVLTLPDIATCVTCCPHDKLLATGLQDNSIRLYFIDTFRPYLKLYGHAYPALSISFSSDASLLVSAGMDKSIKIWGTDFGDLHRSIKAHEDYVMHVQCLPGTHYFASASKDGTAKLWDGDHWDLIQELWRGTSSAVSALCVSHDGGCVLTGDASGWLKAFERTDDTLFLTEEIERRMERAVDKEVEERAMFEMRKRLKADVTSRTVSAVSAADALRERIDRMAHDKAHAPVEETLDDARQRELRLWQFLSQELRSVDFYHALSGLPFDVACTVLRYLDGLLDTRWVDDVERCAHVVSLLGRIHFRNLPNGLLGGLAKKIRTMAESEKRRVGHNLAGLRFVKRFGKTASVSGV